MGGVRISIGRRLVFQRRFAQWYRERHGLRKAKKKKEGSGPAWQKGKKK